MLAEPKTTKPETVAYVLPRYLRYARTLALVSGVTMGIAAGAAVIASSGCETGCTGFCGPIQGIPPTYGLPPIYTDGSTDTTGNDAVMQTDGGGGDAGDTGGGPRPAPLLPRAWMA